MQMRNKGHVKERKRMLSRSRNMKLSSKLVLLIFISLVCIYIILSVFWFVILEIQARDDFYQAGYDMCALGGQMAEQECSYLQGIAAYLSVSSRTQAMLMKSNANLPLSENDRMATELAHLKYPVSVIFFDLQGEPVDWMSIDDSQTPLAQDPQGDTPLSRVLHGPATYAWEFIDQGSDRLFARDNSPKLCLWYLVTDSQTTRPLGAVAIAVDSRRFISMGSTQDSPYFRLILLDQETGAVAFNHSPYQLNEDVCAELIAYSGEEAQGSVVIPYGGARYYLFYERVKSTPLTVYYIIPYSLFVQDGSFWGYFLIVLVFLTLSLHPLLGYASRRLTTPLRELTTTVSGFARGDMNALFEYKGRDEIGILGNAFNEMVRSNRRMLEKTVELKVREQEAELNALQAQINPHFLYNMLNMIYWRAMRSGDEEVADISYAMGQLYRMALNRGHSRIALREEFQICEYYLMLQKKRFGDHIEYNVYAEPGLEGVAVPKLLLQPLVENAIIHGAENYTDVVHISLSARREGENIVFRVVNDGSVIPPEILATLPYCPVAEGTPAGGSRYALRNIAERLKLLFGDAYAFTFASSEESGTVVTISYPLDHDSAILKGDAEDAQSVGRG